MSTARTVRIFFSNVVSGSGMGQWESRAEKVEKSISR